MASGHFQLESSAARENGFGIEKWDGKAKQKHYFIEGTVRVCAIPVPRGNWIMKDFCEFFAFGRTNIGHKKPEERENHQKGQKCHCVSHDFGCCLEKERANDVF